MPLIDSALAFAITMLALSLTCSAFIELIHRFLGMREAGLKYMLEQMFDQVLSKYILPGIETEVGKGTPAVQDRLNTEKKRFVDRMRANRTPMGVTPNATPGDSAEKADKNEPWRFGLWGGRELTALSPVDFMERLGSTDVGEKIDAAFASATNKAADVTDAVMKDIALKFEAMGKDAQDYFEGRARLMSVLLAILIAFVIHVDAIDLFKTYLQNPQATASVIAQSQAITKQMESAQAAVEASKKLAVTATPADQKKSPDPAQPGAPPDAATAQPASAQNTASPDGIKKQVEELQTAAETAVSNAKKMVKQFSDLGVPFGWSDKRVAAADMWMLVWTCEALKDGVTPKHGTLWQECKPNDSSYKVPNGLQYTTVWFGIPTTLNIFLYLVLGGLLIGLGAPFWYNAITGLTSLRNAAGGASGASGAASGSGAAPAAMAVSVASSKAQPVTPVGAFQVANVARQAAKKAADTPTGGAKPSSGSP
jgi:hypothetical protein